MSRVLAKLGDRGDIPEVIKRLANSSAHFRPLVLYTNSLLSDASVPTRLRELVILRLSATVQSHYIHMEHLQIARNEGISEEEIRFAVLELDETPASLSAAELAALAFAGRTRSDDPQMRDIERASLQDELGAEAPIEVMFICSYWGGMMPVFIAALGLSGEEPRGAARIWDV